MWSTLYSPTGCLKYEKLNYQAAKFATLLEELIEENFSGYLEVLALHEHGLIVFHKGRICNCFYEGTDDLDLSREEIIKHFLNTKSRVQESIINVGELDPRVVLALSALENKRPVHRELETVFLDMPKLIATFGRKKFTGSLRFYHIRNNTRLGNILLKLNKITTDQLRDAIRLQLSGEGALRMGDALVQIGAIGAEDVKEALDRQSFARKGSDIEVGLALFSQGVFLGGYTEDDKITMQKQSEVLSWVNNKEVLMDIIEGVLPAPLALDKILPSLSGKAAPKPKPKKSATKTSVKEKARAAANNFQDFPDDTLMLRADDLILEIHSQASPPPADAQKPSAFDKNLEWLREVENGNVSAPPPAPAESLSPVPEFEAFEDNDQYISEAAAALAESEQVSTRPLSPVQQKVEWIDHMFESRMGFLGKALLDREKKKVEIPGRGLTAVQLKSINEHMYASARLIIGSEAAGEIRQDIEEHLGDL